VKLLPTKEEVGGKYQPTQGSLYQSNKTTRCEQQGNKATNGGGVKKVFRYSETMNDGNTMKHEATRWDSNEVATRQCARQ
jgi:hypothetical protein